ncbi:MAG: DUF6456 domain-containing protein [Pseudomonadota bacterium]
MNTEDVLHECTEQAATLFGEKSACCTSKDAAIYLAHTGRGQSIRAIAAAMGAHPSTVMRTVRRIEERRDDPLLDRMLDSLTGTILGEEAADGETAAAFEHDLAPARGVDAARGTGVSCRDPKPEPTLTLDEARVTEEARRYLRRLSEPDSFLLVANGSAKAGVFCAANGHRRPIALFAVELAAEFLRRDWIRIAKKGDASVRYRITDVGRAALRRLLLADARPQRAGVDRTRPRNGFAEAANAFRHQHRLEAERVFMSADGTPETHRVNLGESPLGWLARRPGPDGKSYITPEEVEAGEKLRNDFELAQIGPSVTQDWRRFLTSSDGGGDGAAMPGGAAIAARERFTKAMTVLGPGLGDAALRVCCFLEGLEACEKRMGWSARSGKVVLKLALQRLAEHYGLGLARN